ncbi:MAG: helix-turn-helix transcriptional regulator [Blautia sp.]|nr:helix-turn-helix transcriptional regulator [Blautia sp.]
MTVSYNKLWKLLIDRDMSKTDLVREAKITTNAMARMGKGEDVRIGVIVKICTYLGCTFDDVLEIIPDKRVED